MRHRQFGRQYVVAWDLEVGRYHVTLGNESIGFHKTIDGARAVAAGHARHVTLPGGAPLYSVTVREAAAA